jgi:hypothetical protein
VHLLQQELVGIAMSYFVLQLELEVLAESTMFVMLELHFEQNKIIYLHIEMNTPFNIHDASNAYKYKLINNRLHICTISMDTNHSMYTYI